MYGTYIGTCMHLHSIRFTRGLPWSEYESWFVSRNERTGLSVGFRIVRPNPFSLSLLSPRVSLSSYLSALSNSPLLAICPLLAEKRKWNKTVGRERARARCQASEYNDTIRFEVGDRDRLHFWCRFGGLLTAPNYSSTIVGGGLNFLKICLIFRMEIDTYTDLRCWMQHVYMRELADIEAWSLTIRGLGWSLGIILYVGTIPTAASVCRLLSIAGGAYTCRYIFRCSSTLN